MTISSRDVSKIKLDRLIAVHYQHPNIQIVEQFFLDFGLIVAKREQHRTYYRGFGPEPYVYIAEQSPDGGKHFVGGIWAVQTIADLQYAATLPGASTLVSCTSPGEGKQVILTDPAGVQAVLTHGVAVRPASEVQQEEPRELPLNRALHKHRTGVHGLVHGPTSVAKCGHYGLRVADSQFDETLSWYTSSFNLGMSSCLQHPSEGQPLMCFLRIDKGKEFVDHHVRERVRGTVNRG